jgi:hypothetical protein
MKDGTGVGNVTTELKPIGLAEDGTVHVSEARVIPFGSEYVTV